MKSRAWLLPLLLTTAISGCVERRFVITTEPMGAQVFVNGEPLTPTPTDRHFIYYGKYEFLLVADGYETQRVVQEIERPWYQYPVIDFFAENVIPYRFQDVRRLHFPMVPLQKERPDQVLQRGIELRQRGQAIVSPPPSPGQVSPRGEPLIAPPEFNQPPELAPGPELPPPTSGGFFNPGGP